MKRYVPLAACGILLSAGCASDGRAKLLEEAYRTGKGTPAQFATDKIIRDRETGRAIRSWLGTDIPRIPEAEAERSVKALLCDIRSGLNWRLKPPRYNLPRISAGEWTHALKFDRAFPLGQTAGAGGTRWFLGWTPETLEVRVECVDPAPVSSRKQLWEGDCIELFLWPDIPLMLYAEYLVTPHGGKRSIYHLRTEEGIVHYGIDRRGPEFTAAAGLTPDGYFVTCSIPWNKLAGLWEKREAVPGNRVRLALVRCDWNGESGSPPVKTSPYPLLYDGHNLYGYAEFILTR